MMKEDNERKPYETKLERYMTRAAIILTIGIGGGFLIKGCLEKAHGINRYEENNLLQVRDLNNNSKPLLEKIVQE